MKQSFAFILLAPLVFLFVSCPMPTGDSSQPQKAPQQPPQPAPSTPSKPTLTLATDTSRDQAVLVTQSGTRIDISATIDDGTTVSASNAESVAIVSQGSGSSQSASSGDQAVIIGTRKDGNPGVWAYSGGKIQAVIDEDSGVLTCALPQTGEHDGTFKGQFGWVYHVMGISEDGKMIIGYAENKKGFSHGKFQIDPGTTIGVYWRVSRHPARPYFLASHAHIIGIFDLSQFHGGKGHHRWGGWVMEHILDHLKWFLLDYLTSYLVMVDKDGVHFDSANNDYLVSGTDQDNDPAVAAIDQKGNITITAQPTSTATITTVAGTGTGGYNGDNISATSAQLWNPVGLAFDSSGNLFIGDSANNRVRKVAAGTITTAAGNGTAGYAGDGGPASSAEFSQPDGVALDSAGNLYVADKINSVIRKVSTSGTITTVAGNGTAGYSGNGQAATSAELYRPFSVAVDVAGNIYIGDTFNNVVRKVSTSGIITTVAGTGTGGYSGDGGAATSAQLADPFGVAVDAAGNLYIADSLNNVIRKVSSSGNISTVAGNQSKGAGYSGDGSAATSAQLNQPYGLAVDQAGNIFIADTFNNVVRRVSTSGVITTVAGTGTAGYAGDGGAPTSAKLNQPYGVSVDQTGSLYIADSGNNVVRVVR